MPTIRKKITFRVCQVCGNQWPYKKGTKDPRCTNPDCRSRKWNQTDIYESGTPPEDILETESILNKLREQLNILLTNTQ